MGYLIKLRGTSENGISHGTRTQHVDLALKFASDLSRIVLVPLRHVPTGYVSYWLRFVQVGSSIAFGHGPADSCGH